MNRPQKKHLIAKCAWIRSVLNCVLNKWNVYVIKLNTDYKNRHNILLLSLRKRNHLVQECDDDSFINIVNWEVPVMFHKHMSPDKYIKDILCRRHALK